MKTYNSIVKRLLEEKHRIRVQTGKDATRCYISPSITETLRDDPEFRKACIRGDASVEGGIITIYGVEFIEVRRDVHFHVCE